MEEKRQVDIAKVSMASQDNYEKRGFSEVSSANDSDTSSSNTTTGDQLNEGFSEISSANQGDQNDSNDNTPEKTENE